MSQRFKLACLPLLLSAALLGGCGGKDEGQLLGSAKAFLQKKDNKSATLELKTLLQQNPKQAEARFLLGQALLNIGDLAGAEAELRRALEYKHPREQVLPVLARALMASGQEAAVVKEFAGVKLEPAQAQADLLVSLSLAQLTLGQLPAAQAAIDAALNLDSSALQAQLAKARVQASAGDLPAALSTLDAALAQHPKAAQAWVLKGEMLWRGKGEAEAAREAFKQALSSEPALFEAHAALISLALAERKPAQAREQLTAARKAGVGGSKTQYIEAQLSFAEGDYKKTRELVQALRRHAPDYVPLLSLAALTELNLNSLTEADALATRAAQQAPNQPPLQRLQAQILLRMQQPGKVLQVLKPLLDASSKDAEALSLAGQAQLLLGDTAAADEYFGRAAKIRPDDLRVRAALAMSQLDRGNSATALHDLAAIAANDQGSSVDMALISAQIRRKDVNGALRAIEALELKLPGSPVPDSLRGQLYMSNNDWPKARKAFEASLARDAGFLVSVAGLSAADVAEKKPEPALQRLRDFIKSHPKDNGARLALAQLMQRVNQPREQVAALLAEAVRTDPLDAGARIMQLDLLLSGRDAKAALEAAQAAVAALPNNPDMIERLARAQLASGDRAQALANFGRLTNLSPESAAGPWGAVQIRVASGDFTAAQRDLRRVLELTPDSIPARELAVQLALKQQKPAEALQHAKDMQTRFPKLAAGWIAEGLVEQSQKRWDPALAAYRKALAMQEPVDAALRVHATLVAAQRQAEAQSFAESWSKSHAADLRFAVYLADQLMAKGDLPAAEKAYLDLLKRSPELVPALNNIAWIRATQKRPGALEMIEKAVSLAGDQPAILDTYAMVLAGEQQLPKALSIQQKAVALAPDEPDLRLNLGRYLIQSGNKAQALTELQKLSKLGKAYPKQTEVSALLRQAN